MSTLKTRIMGMPVEFITLEDGTLEGRFLPNEFGIEWDFDSDGFNSYPLPYALRSTYAQREGQLMAVLFAMVCDAQDYMGSEYGDGRDEEMRNALTQRSILRACTQEDGGFELFAPSTY